VKTGEENEDIKFSERCKLFRFFENEWKERGIGNIKILKNKDTGKHRILMRREQIHKLCANHAITPELELKVTAKENQIIWAANDFSEEQVQLEKFLVRFKHVEQARKFREAFEEAKKSTPKTPSQEKTKEPLKNKDENLKVRLAVSSNSENSFRIFAGQADSELRHSSVVITRSDQHTKEHFLVWRVNWSVDNQQSNVVGTKAEGKGRQEQKLSSAESFLQLLVRSKLIKQIVL
jgi:RanBP1 domain